MSLDLNNVISTIYDVPVFLIIYLLNIYFFYKLTKII